MRVNPLTVYLKEKISCSSLVNCAFKIAHTYNERNQSTSNVQAINGQDFIVFSRTGC